LYHFTDEQWNNLKAILTDNKDGFTDDQWKMVVDEVSMLSTQFLVLLDTRLQSINKHAQTFGGISVLLISDFIQLPVTTGRDLWSVM
jgi:hypothetical protein